MITLQDLTRRAKQSFNIAVVTGAFRPEGMVIQMKSGLILDGHSQKTMNAARDALRSIIPAFPTDENIAPHILDDFTIATVAIVVVEKMMRIPKRIAGSHPPVYEMSLKPRSIANASDATMATLEDYPAISKDAFLYVVSHRETPDHRHKILSVITLENQLKWNF